MGTDIKLSPSAGNAVKFPSDDSSYKTFAVKEQTLTFAFLTQHGMGWFDTFR